MQLGLVGLGRMGANMVRRLMRDGAMRFGFGGHVEQVGMK
jgi:6-phosphogluconate dehydrogenase (decarboxylating)